MQLGSKKQSKQQVRFWIPMIIYRSAVNLTFTNTRLCSDSAMRLRTLN
jgi:hypothetical protein